jgi:hypothetical protein
MQSCLEIDPSTFVLAAAPRIGEAAAQSFLHVLDHAELRAYARRIEIIVEAEDGFEMLADAEEAVRGAWGSERAHFKCEQIWTRCPGRGGAARLTFLAYDYRDALLMRVACALPRSASADVAA